jgi:hypothetical protein
MTNDDTLDDLYFDWLRAKALPPRGFNYEELLLLLYRTEFTVRISNDQNRAADGIELRYDFLREGNYPREAHWLEQPCSVLEFLIGFAKRAAFLTDMPVRDWFWKMLGNLGLDEFRQISDPSEEEFIRNRLDIFMERQYDRNGNGGLFPLRNSRDDQRKVEIWYQFSEYVQAENLI